MKKTIFFFLAISNSLFAQLSGQEYLDKYKEGVRQYNDAQYEEAYLTLSNLTQRNYKNEVVPYAYLYGALAAEKKGSKYQSRILLKNILQNDTDWDKLNHARIIYAKSNLADGYYDEGIKTLHEIDDPGFDNLKNKLIEEYIGNVRTITALKNLYNSYPNYRPIAKALVDKIQANRYNTKADLELSDMLTNRFSLIEQDNKSEVQKKPKRSVKRSAEELNFGLLLPFNSAKTEPDPSYLYVYDLYFGMQVAAEELNRDGIRLNLHTYDINNNANSFKLAEKKPGFGNLNLIVGPLYAAPNNLAQTYISNNDVIQVHPISNNLSLLSKSNSVFLMQPSYTQQSKKVLDYMSTLGNGKSVSVYFGESRKDSTFAKIYADEAKKRGFSLKSITRFTGQKLNNEASYVFFAGDNNLGQRFLQTAAANNLKSEVIITASSFSWDRINTSYFRDNVSIIYPEFVNRDKESVQEFEKAYFQKTAYIPSYYSYLGYDLVHYFGTMLKDGEDLFKLNINLGEYIDSYLLSGYDFSGKTKQNEIVPIIKYNNGDFEEVFR